MSNKIHSLISDFERVESIDLQPGDDPISSTIDKINGFIYFGSGGSPARITKVSINPLSRISSIDLNPGEDYTWIGLIDNKRGFLYFATYNTPSKIIKIQLSNFTRVGDLTTSLNQITTGILDEDSGFAYFADIDTGSIIKINLETFKEERKLQTSVSGGIWSSDIDKSSGYGYFGAAVSGNNISDIVKIRLSDLTEAAKLILSPIELSPSQIYIDSSKGFGYFANYYDPPNFNKIVKVVLADLTKDPSSPIDGAIGGSFGGAIDTIGEFIYLGGDGDPSKGISGSIVKIDLSTFEKVDNINLGTGENYPDTAVIDEINGYVYFGIYPYANFLPKVIKIRIIPCIPKWECEQPLNGYEKDGCGNRRQNPLCIPPIKLGFGNAGPIFVLGLAIGYMLFSKKKKKQ